MSAVSPRGVWPLPTSLLARRASERTFTPHSVDPTNTTIARPVLPNFLVPGS